MQVNYNDNQSFGSLICSGNMMARLSTPKRYEQFQDIIHYMKKCPVDCFVTPDKNGRLTAELNGKFLSEEMKESSLAAFLNFNPIRFIEKVCAKAEKIETQEEKIASKHCGRTNCEVEI